MVHSEYSQNQSASLVSLVATEVVQKHKVDFLKHQGTI